MTETPQTEEGLHILGPAGPNFPGAQGGDAQTDAGTTTWVAVRPDGTVTAYAGKAELGQGIRSGFAMEVADELRVPLSAVEMIVGDTGLVPWDMGTFGSMSTALAGVQLRKAAATARQALLELAADRLDLPVSELSCTEAAVVPGGDRDRAVGYGDLVAGKHVSKDIDDEVELTQAADFTVMGKHAVRMDAESRVTGEAQFSQDVILPGMLYASVLRRPSNDAKLVDVDTSIAERMPGVVQVARDGDLVAVLAETDEQAEQAMKLLQARWDEQPDHPSHLDVPELLLRDADEGFATQEAGSLEEGFGMANKVLEATYYIPYVSVAPMEPRAAVARWEDGGLTVWAGTQRPFGIRSELAQRFEMEESDVRVIAPEVGGGFGSKSMYPVAGEAARLAKIAGRPVRIAYTREEEMAWTAFRPAALFQVKSGFTSEGKVVAWEFKAYHAGDRQFSGRRGSQTPYDIPHVNVTAYTSKSPLRTGSYRSLGGALNHFARESHMDEIAAEVGLDPVELRLRNLSHPRFRRVLETAAERFGWSAGPTPSKRGFGAAIGLDVGSYAGICLDLDIQGSEVRVGRVSVALDCGLTVNPDGAANQVEGCIVMGMGTALYEAIDFQGGRVLNAGFTRYRVPRITNAPEIDVALVGDAETPSTGAGEPAIVPVAAAIANAIFDLNGERYRELPIQRHLRS